MAAKVPAGMPPFPGILGTEYTLMDKIGSARGLIDMFATRYPQLQGIDFRREPHASRFLSTSSKAGTS